MKEEDNSRLVEVFSGSRWEAELIKGLLESNEIAAALKDGLITTIAPYISPTVSLTSWHTKNERIPLLLYRSRFPV